MLFFISVYCLVEEGYFYSVKAKKFLTYHPTRIESRIFLAAENIRPKKFRINELKPPYSGSVRITPVERDPKDVVLDKSGYNSDLIQYSEHGDTNQIVTMEIVPKMLVKLKVDGKCFTTPVDKYYLRAVECKNFEEDPGQYFRWIPDTLEKILQNPSSIESFIKNISRKMNNVSDYDRRERECIREKPRQTQSQAVDVPEYFDMLLAPNANPYPKPSSNSGSPGISCISANRNNNIDGDELLERLHQFDKFMLGNY